MHSRIEVYIRTITSKKVRDNEDGRSPLSLNARTNNFNSTAGGGGSTGSGGRADGAGRSAGGGSAGGAGGSSCW